MNELHLMILWNSARNFENKIISDLEKNVTIIDKAGVKTYDNLHLVNTISTDLMKLLSVPPQRQTVYNLHKIYFLSLFCNYIIS